MKINYRWIDNYGLLLEGYNGSKGDALLRTMYLLQIIEYSYFSRMTILERQLLKDAIRDGFKSCTFDYYNTNGVARHPELIEEKTTSSNNLEFNAASMVYCIKGLAPRSFLFLFGTPLLPPLAGITPNTFINM